MLKGNYEVEVLVNGHPAREYIQKGKFYIEGRKEVPYRIKVRNNGHSRIKAVISVDGLSVLSGEKATLLGVGYIINGYDSLIVEGWRKSNENVHEFYFSDPSDSYSARSENGEENIGIIGVSIVEEEFLYHWLKYNDNNTMIPDPFSPQYPITNATYSMNTLTYTNNESVVTNCSNTIGTGWGKEISSGVTNVTFNGKSSPAQIFEIFYDTKEGLRRRGVNLEKRPVYTDTLSAFPGSKYCKEPR